jgi:hypothetical protein
MHSNYVANFINTVVIYLFAAAVAAAVAAVVVAVVAAVDAAVVIDLVVAADEGDLYIAADVEWYSFVVAAVGMLNLFVAVMDLNLTAAAAVVKCKICYYYLELTKSLI